MTRQPWSTAPLVALDLEGTGGQDRDREQILEIAIVPLDGGFPDMNAAWDTTVNPGRMVAPRPWIARELTSDILSTAPALDDIRAEIVDRLDARIIVGHNIGVDWRLLRRLVPEAQPSALIDTAQLYRHSHPASRRWNLVRLLEKYALNAQVHQLVPASHPHRALWDAAGAALLLPALIEDLPSTTSPTMEELTHLAGVPLQSKASRTAEVEQVTLDVRRPPHPEEFCMNTALRDELLRRMERDQAVRTATPLGQPMTEQAWQEWQQVDHDNTRFLKEVIAEHGWPGRDLVGDDAGKAAWLLAQHADHDVVFQRRCLELLREAAAAGQAMLPNVAYLTDRVYVAEGRPQLYGTQYHERDGRLQPRPIEDPEHLDQRRAQMGLSPHAEYDQHMHEQYDLPQEQPRELP